MLRISGSIIGSVASSCFATPGSSLIVEARFVVPKDTRWESTRVSESRVSFGTTKRAATIKEEPGVAKHDDETEPMMDPEIRSIRRLAMKQRYG